LESLRDDDTLGRVTRGLASEHLRRAGEEGPVKGVRLRDAYRCTLPTANLMRALGSIGVELVGIELPAGAGELLGVVAEVDEIRLMDHMKHSRPGAGRYWALKPLWDSGCYSLADVRVAIDVPGRLTTAKAVASARDLGNLACQRGLPTPCAPRLNAALANLANWVQLHPDADPPKSSGELPFHIRQFRADLQEKAQGPCSTDGALRWRAKRPHVPTALPDRSTDDPAPPRATVPTGRGEQRVPSTDGPVYKGTIISGPPADMKTASTASTGSTGTWRRRRMPVPEREGRAFSAKRGLATRSLPLDP
jgi:hypothetical protein